jgi:hypothetical protein
MARAAPPREERTMSARKLDEALQQEATGQWAQAADSYRELLGSGDRTMRCRAHIRHAR